MQKNEDYQESKVVVPDRKSLSAMPFMDLEREHDLAVSRMLEAYSKIAGKNPEKIFPAFISEYLHARHAATIIAHELDIKAREELDKAQELESLIPESIRNVFKVLLTPESAETTDAEEEQDYQPAENDQNQNPADVEDLDDFEDIKEVFFTWVGGFPEEDWEMLTAYAPKDVIERLAKKFERSNNFLKQPSLEEYEERNA